MCELLSVSDLLLCVGFFCNSICMCRGVCRVFGTSMVEEYEEIADSQYLSERMEYLDEDYGKI